MYSGIEVDMLSLGDADSILATRWEGVGAQRILIDGGNSGDYETVRGFLRKAEISHLDAIVCTHLHDDHAAGLVELVNDRSITIGRAYLLVPQFYLEMSRVEKALGFASSFREASVIEKSLQTASDLCTALVNRRIPIAAPLQGTRIEFLTVLGPSEEYYRELLSEFEDADKIKAVSEKATYYDLLNSVHEYLSEKSVIKAELLDNPEDTPENNSSVILGTLFENAKYLFTADAGVPALQRAADAYDLRSCHWMQIPH